MRQEHQAAGLPKNSFFSNPAFIYAVLFFISALPHREEQENRLSWIWEMMQEVGKVFITFVQQQRIER